MKQKINKNKGFVVTSAMIAWVLGFTALFGGGAYLVNKTIDNGDAWRENNGRVGQNRAKRDVVVDSANNILGGRHGRDGMDHSFVPDHDELAGLEMGDLSDFEREGMISMREEEKLARDVYRTLYDKWGVQTFQNISYSENRHSLAVKTLLDRYNVEDPVENDSTGAFTIPAMQKLYDDLVVKGSVSVIEALNVGATIEDLDIYDLHKWIAGTDNEDIRVVYENLLRGSHNHMRSFMGQLEANSVSYAAQFLSQAEIDKILAAKQERGRYSGKMSGSNSRQGMHKGGNGNYKNAGWQQKGMGRRQGWQEQGRNR